IYVEHNDTVTKGQPLALIDPLIYKAAVAGNKAALATRKAEVERAKALLQQAKNDERRAKALRAENKTFISEADVDQVTFNRQSLEAQLDVAITKVDQAQAALDKSEADLEYTVIRAPEGGTANNRKVSTGHRVQEPF